MNKIFINDRPFCFTDNIEVELKNKVLEYDSPESVLKAVELLEHGYLQELYFFSADMPGAKREFLKLFQYLEAAGGVVKNKKKQILCILRFSKWDLPKGKIETGESSEEAALREVEEECGITGLSIIRELPSSYHTYLQDGKRMLKRTYWYEMSYSGDSNLKPQQEEHITDVKWMNKAKLMKALMNTYNTIREVLGKVEVI